MNPLDEVVAAQKRGEARGIAAICSAHPVVLQTALEFGKTDETPVLVEATCNQVNPFGGYTGMTPKDFVAWIRNMADRLEFPRGKLILGGDHLGPTPWQAEPAAAAMGKSKEMVQAYVRAGFTKLHLDASLRLGDDPPGPLAVAVAAERAAELAAAAEAAADERGWRADLRYVVGTDVPIAGGLRGEEDELKLTAVPDLAATLQKSRQSFSDRGLESAWERVIAVVVQPGVEFGDETIHAYEPLAAAGLSKFIESQPQVFEAHSTDYQTQTALRQMVADHFAILKVGPALTFAFREAVFALTMIEAQLFPEETRSNLVEVLDAAMLANPTHWQKHYHGDATALKLARKFSFSDRSRYYWGAPTVRAAYCRLRRNFGDEPIPLSLLSQYFPQEYVLVRNQELANQARELIQSKIRRILRNYDQAGSEYSG